MTRLPQASTPLHFCANVVSGMINSFRQKLQMDKFVTRRVVIALASTCLVLSAICVALAVALLNQNRPRFSSTDKTFIMFDNKTAQACWSGERTREPSEEEKNVDKDFAKYSARRTSPNTGPFPARDPNSGLPYCVDLK